MSTSEITQVYDQTMDHDFVDAVLSRIRYKESWKLHWIENDGLLLFEWKSERPDSRTGQVEIGSGGPNFLRTYDLTEESLVRMVFAAALRFEEHECREFFMYDDQRPFDPHKELIVPLGHKTCTCRLGSPGALTWNRDCIDHGIGSGWYKALDREDASAER